MTPSDPATVARVVARACPLQAELLGPSTVNHLVQGGTLASSPGGRHIDLNTAAQAIGCVAAIVQVALAALPAWQAQKQDQTLTTLVEELARQRASVDTNLTRLLNTDPAVLRRIAQALEHEQGE